MGFSLDFTRFLQDFHGVLSEKGILWDFIHGISWDQDDIWDVPTIGEELGTSKGDISETDMGVS